MRYRITFFKLSKTRRPNSIATGIDEKSFFNKMIEADFENKNLMRMMIMKKKTRCSRKYAPASLATSLPLF